MHQDPKFHLGAIINRASGRHVPAHVPVMVFLATDALAAQYAIRPYVLACEARGLTAHAQSAAERLNAFHQFAHEHPEQMKAPDTATASQAQEPAVMPFSIDGHYSYALSGGNVVQFVKPGENDTLLPGTTTEEVLRMLMDRIATQNRIGPSVRNTEILEHLGAALVAQEARVSEMAADPAPHTLDDAAVRPGELRFGIFMHKCESSNLADYGYDVPRRVLALGFKVKGSDQVNTYHYRDVPQHVYNGLIEAESKGAYATREIVRAGYEGVRQEANATAVGGLVTV